MQGWRTILWATVAGVFVAGLARASEADVLLSPSAGLKPQSPVAEDETAWTYTPSGDAVFHFRKSEGADRSFIRLGHQAFPSNSLANTYSPEEHRLGVDYRSPLFSNGFLESRSYIDESTFGHHQSGYRQVLGYGLRIIDRQSVTFEIVPGVSGDYSADRSLEERLRWMGNLGQNLTWAVTDGIVLNQNFNTSLERTEADDLSAVLNLDLETLLAERLSFKLSYEVHYDDSIGDEMEQRDARLSTSVGFRF